MTVKQLYDELGQLIKEGYGDTRVIANCEFNITKGNGYYNNFPLSHLKDVYYQSGDIELDFSQEEEFTEENKYKYDNDEWHDLRKDSNDLPVLETELLCQKYSGRCFVGYYKDDKFYSHETGKSYDVVRWLDIGVWWNILPKE